MGGVMKFLGKIVAHKLFAWSVLVSVGVWILIVPVFSNDLGANPVEKLLHQSGEIAIWTLGVVLTLTPLRVLFPKSPLVGGLNRHRRLIGVAACAYGLVHVALHLLYEGSWEAVERSLSKPFIWFGLSGLTILVVLAITSNQVSIRLLGRNWKRLHRVVYLAAALLLYHQAIAGKGHWHIGRWLVFSLAALQVARLMKTFLNRRRLAVAGNASPARTADPGRSANRRISPAAVTEPGYSDVRSTLVLTQ